MLAPHADTGSSRYARLLVLVLCISCFLRLYLVLSGGQLFWPDEAFRYGKSRAAVHSALSGDFRSAIEVLSSADHYLFKIIGVIPAVIEAAVFESPKIPGLFFSFFSTLNLWLFWRLSRALGAGDRETLISAVLFSCSSTFFYYSRHILPYDLSMTFGLLALTAGLKEPSRSRDSFLCGAMAGCTFLTYNGYWTIAAFAMLAHACGVLRQPERLLRRSLFAGIGLALPMVSAVSLSAALGLNMLGQFAGFSTSIIEGLFSEGWSLPIEYLWHAEHGLFIIWCLGLVYCLKEAVRGGTPRRVAAGIGGCAFIYLMLVVFSVMLHKFVVYGRLARQCVPLFCILTAYGMERLRVSEGWKKYLFHIAMCIIVAQAGYNFSTPLTQSFPDDFRASAEKVAVSSPDRSYELIIVDNLNYSKLLPQLALIKPRAVIMEAKNPLDFFPYQYEGFTPQERRMLRSRDISMRLIEN